MPKFKILAPSMKKSVIFILLVTLTSCKKFINWGKLTFNQGCKLQDVSCVPKNHIRSVRIYDQFNTISIIDGMWLSPDVISSYVDLYSIKNGFNAQEKENKLNHELKTIQDKFAFYILVWQQVKCGQDLDNINPYWHVVLHTDMQVIVPKIIKRVDLPCEYVTFFGKRKNAFQKAFYVEFDASDKFTSHLTLCFTSLNKKAFLKWQLSDSKLVCFDVDYCDDLDYCDTYCGHPEPLDLTRDKLR